MRTIIPNTKRGRFIFGTVVVVVSLVVAVFWSSDNQSVADQAARAAGRAADWCAQADLQDLKVAEMIRRDSAEAASGHYVPDAKLQQMARDKAIQQNIAATAHSTCRIGRRTEQFMTELAVLSERYDLRRLRSYSPDERQAIFSAASVSSDGPQSNVEKLRLLRVFRDRPELYK